MPLAGAKGLRTNFGVVRAVLKRCYVDRTKLEPLQRYRTALTDRAVALLAHRPKRRNMRDVRSAMQMAEATALDALLHDRGAMTPGSRLMAASLSTMMLLMLDLLDDQPVERQAEDGEAFAG